MLQIAFDLADGFDALRSAVSERCQFGSPDDVALSYVPDADKSVKMGLKRARDASLDLSSDKDYQQFKIDVRVKGALVVAKGTPVVRVGWLPALLTGMDTYISVVRCEHAPEVKGATVPKPAATGRRRSSAGDGASDAATAILVT